MAETILGRNDSIPVNVLDPFSPASVSEEAKLFIETHGLADPIDKTLRLAKQAFPVNAKPSIHLHRDPETEGEWIVIDVEPRSTPDVAIHSYNQFVQAWISQSSPIQRDLIRLTFSLI
jgi:hypothetical protein